MSREFTLEEIDQLITNCNAEIHNLHEEIKDFKNKIEIDREVIQELLKNLKTFQNMRKELGGEE